VVVASVEPELEVVASRKVKLVADALIAEAAREQYDLVVLPGGMPGAERLRDSAELGRHVPEASPGRAAFCSYLCCPSGGAAGQGVACWQESRHTQHSPISFLTKMLCEQGW